MEDHIKDANEFHRNLYSSFSDEEQEVKVCEEEGDDLEATLNDGEIDDYCKKFVDFNVGSDA